jgi:hypothetical protein
MISEEEALAYAFELHSELRVWENLDYTHVSTMVA